MNHEIYYDILLHVNIHFVRLVENTFMLAHFKQSRTTMTT
jgi:hypothetical protein